MEPTFFLFPLIAIGSPFLSFFAGVLLADRGQLYPHIPRRTLYLTAVPTGLVIPAMLAGSAVVTIGDTTYYGYMQDEFKLAAFVGTVMVYGSAAPELFAALRSKVIEQGRGKS